MPSVDPSCTRCTKQLSPCAKVPSDDESLMCGCAANMLSVSVFVCSPICAGMLMTPQTIGNVLFWQWVNQTYNAGFNYSNRSGLLM